VWLDSNANGIQDPGEPGIAGVTVMLTNTATGVTTIAVTNDNGKYLFSALAGGTYTVQVVLSTVPPGHTATTPTTVGVNLADGGTFKQADFGFTQVVAALPRTGADNGRIALVGLMLLLVGGLLVRSVRRGLRDQGEQAAVDS
jgi:LPXTG-motif cell wall-anchored protein